MAVVLVSDWLAQTLPHGVKKKRERASFLQLGLGVVLDALQHAQAGLQGRHGLLGLLLGGLELGLQGLQQVLVALLGGLDLAVKLLDLGLAVVGAHGGGLLELLQLLGLAGVLVVQGAHGAQVLLNELLQAVEGASALVVLGIAAGPVLDGGVATHAILRAHALVFSAVNVADDGGFGVGVLSGKLVPSWLHTLAVASPRRLELDKALLPEPSTRSSKLSGV